MGKSPYRILLINYYWPPSGGPAVQRWLDFSRLLLDYNIETTVITIDPKKATYPQMDTKLVAKVPESVLVHTTDTSELFWLYQKFTKEKEVKPVGLSGEKKQGWKQQFARFVRGNLLIPDPRRGWVAHAVKKAEQLLSNQHFDALVTSGTPHSTHLAGLALKKQFGLPWLADFHDEWSTHWTLKQFYRLAPAQAYDAYLEKKVVNSADIVISHCKSASQLLAQKLKREHREKLKVIYMGFDASLFANKEASTSETQFQIVYTGSMGSAYPSASFFAAVRNVKNEHPALALKIVFAGVMGSAIQQEAEKAGVWQLVERLGYRPHAEVVTLIQKANMLLLINPLFEGEKRIVPGKLFEYLAAQQPILNIASPEGEAAKIIEHCKAGETFSPTNETGMTQYLLHAVEAWRKHQTYKLDNAACISEYTRQQGTKRLAETIKTLCK